MIRATIGGNQAVFQISARAGLAVGDYTGRVSLQACSDPNSTQQTGNSPIAIAYTMRVLARMRVTPRKRVLRRSVAHAQRPIADFDHAQRRIAPIRSLFEQRQHHGWQPVGVAAHKLCC